MYYKLKIILPGVCTYVCMYEQVCLNVCLIAYRPTAACLISSPTVGLLAAWQSKKSKKLYTTKCLCALKPFSLSLCLFVCLCMTINDMMMILLSNAIIRMCILDEDIPPIISLIIVRKKKRKKEKKPTQNIIVFH